MKKVYVGKNQYALVDNEDYVLVSKRKWHIINGYAASYNSLTGNSDILMHRLVMDSPKGVSTDHINHNRLDNRKTNLRLCTRGQNSRNNKPFAESGYKGVYKNFHKWNARIHHNGKSIFLGTHATKELAAAAYNEAALKLFGDFAYQNVIREFAA